MLQGLTGPELTWHSGEVHDVPPAIAKRYTEAGIAEYVDKGEGDEPSPPAKRARKAKSSKVTQKR